MVIAKMVPVVGVFLALTAFALSPSPTVPTELLPQGWEGMEIEAKWELTAAQYGEVVKYFPDNVQRYGLRANVRSSGVPKRFVDHYFDDGTASGTLGKARHVLRHRTRSTAAGMTAKSTLADLIGAEWTEDWQKMQYKSNPCRIGATWFRTESGECNLADADNQDLCEGAPFAAADLLAGVHLMHPAMRALAKDHPKLRLDSLKPVLTVVDYRYRVELLDRIDAKDVPIYELSLDRIVEEDSTQRVTYELEVEHLRAPARPSVERLLTIATDLEARFKLQPSVRSKGGTDEVGACSTGR